MIGSEQDEMAVGEKIHLMDIVYESRFFIVNLLGIYGLGWIAYELFAGIVEPHRLYTGLAMLAVCLFNTYWRMFFVTGFRHRYFSHRSFKTKVPGWLRWLVRTPRQEERYLRGA